MRHPPRVSARALVSLFTLPFVVPPTTAFGLESPTPWAVILCKFADHPEGPPESPGLWSILYGTFAN